MTQFRTIKIAAISGLGIFAVVAMPGLTAVAGAVETAQAKMQRAHMDNVPGGGDRGGQAGPGFGMGPGMMGPGMMGPGAGVGSGRMGPGMGMGPGMMMGSGMMGPGHGMGRGMRPGQGFGGRIVPWKDLSTDDVRHSLEHRLEWQGNKRLKVGEVKQADDDTIIADIVTKENSLVQRLKVDRHTGRMQQVN